MPGIAGNSPVPAAVGAVSASVPDSFTITDSGVVINNGSDVYVPVTGGYAFGLVTANTATVIANNGVAAKYLLGYKNLAKVAQTVTFTAYDNASAASGVVASKQVALQPKQLILFKGPGIQLKNGCTVLASGNPVSPGVAVIVK